MVMFRTHQKYVQHFCEVENGVKFALHTYKINNIKCHWLNKPQGSFLLVIRPLIIKI